MQVPDIYRNTVNGRLRKVNIALVESQSNNFEGDWSNPLNQSPQAQVEKSSNESIKIS